MALKLRLPPPTVSFETLNEHLKRLYQRRSAVDHLIRSLVEYQHVQPSAYAPVHTEREIRRAAD
jgi:hypothetical protein